MSGLLARTATSSSAELFGQWFWLVFYLVLFALLVSVVRWQRKTFTEQKERNQRHQAAIEAKLDRLIAIAEERKVGNQAIASHDRP